MRIIFSISYLSVPETICLANDSCGEYLIVTTHPLLNNMYRKVFGRRHVIFIDNPVRGAVPLKRILDIPALFLSMWKSWKILKGYRNSDVYFSFVAFCELEAWLIKKLSINNCVYYSPIVDTSNFKHDRSLRSRLKIIIKKIIYLIDLKPMKSYGVKYDVLSEKYFEKIGSKKYEVLCDKKDSARIIASTYRINKGARILILCGGVCGIYSDEYEYTDRIDRMINALITRYGADSIQIKAHPVMNDYHSKECDLNKISNEVPANLIMSQFDVVIGYSTATLFEAASQGITSISLLKYLAPIRESDRDDFIEYLSINSDNNIYYPDCLDSILEYIKPIQKCISETR